MLGVHIKSDPFTKLVVRIACFNVDSYSNIRSNESNQIVKMDTRID